MALLVLLTSTGEAATGDKRTQLLNQLVVELDPSRLGKSVSEYARDAANGDFHALSSLGSPKSVSPLIPHRIADDEIKQLDPKSPEYRLQNMLLLDFSSEFETNEAAMALARNSNVVNIEQTVLGKYLADPLIPIVAQKPKYQWGLYSLNVITSTDPVGVWAKTRGSAYVAALDNGIYTTPSVHEDLAANYRPQLSYNYGAATNGDSGLPTTTNNLHETDAPTDFPAGHGTHVAGLIAAWNGNGLGGSGVCPSCSLMLGRVTTMAEPWPGYFSPEPNFTYVAAAVDGLSRHGAQVINMSFGPPESTVTQQLDATRTAIASAVARDVFLVGASGNAQYDLVDFPASIADHVTAVGGIGSNDRAWEGSGGFGSNWSRTFQVQQFVAPADTVISTIYPAREWNANYACGDSFPSGFMAGYGDCTGTSMAAPHVAGVVALMRSVDPLKSRTQIRDILAATTPVDGTNNTCAGTSKVICQLGRPDAVAAVSGALGGTNVINRKTPLFSFYSTTALDHFYTVVPQMSMAALNQGALWPQPAAATAVAYGPIGSSISQYTAFPQSNCSPTPCSATPKAIAVVYTTHKDPLGGADLVPLYRLSYRCGDELLTSPPNAPNPICATTPRHLSHFYTTDEFAIRLYTGRYLNGVSDPSNPGIGYKLDGIEGFIYSNSVGQPSGTKKLCRKYDGARDDYVLFVGAGASGTDCSATTDGFSGGNYNQLVGGTDWIGWVFPATTSLGPTPSNNLPTITITSPSNGATFGGGTNVPISATAADSGGSIAEVRFFVEQRRVGTDTSSPYS
ncbi:MAG TPA: S8 family serine peptidase, partial [Anaerolineales bacterium]|nr:S8 family serine peptidase [Anaerolineales bacterium]